MNFILTSPLAHSTTIINVLNSSGEPTRVGRAPLHALQKKILIRDIVLAFQILFNSLYVSLEEEVASILSSSQKIALYADRTEYFHFSPGPNKYHLLGAEH